MFDYNFEKLNQSISVCVTPEHKFGTDAFLLANFANPRHKDLVCDLGTGCGIIPFILYKHHQPKHIYGVDIQEQAIEQFKLGITQSGLSEQITPLCCDLNQLTDLPFGQFDVITCNPPYKANGAGIISELSAEKIARHETMCTIQDICSISAKLLKFGGKLCLCQRPERLVDVMVAMHNAKIEPKRLRMVAKNKDMAPWLFLIEGKRGSKSFMNVLPTLEVYDDMEFSEEMKNIYGWEEPQ